MYSLGDNSRIGKQKLLVNGINYTTREITNNKKNITHGRKILHILTQNRTIIDSHNLQDSSKSDYNNLNDNLSSDLRIPSTANLIDKNQIVNQGSKNDNDGARYIKPTMVATKPRGREGIEDNLHKFNKTHDIGFKMLANTSGTSNNSGNIGYAQKPSKTPFALNEININGTNEIRRRRMESFRGGFNTSSSFLEAIEEKSDIKNVNFRANNRLLIIMCPFLWLFGIATPLGKDKLFNTL